MALVYFLSNGLSLAKSQSSPWIDLLVFYTQSPQFLLEIPTQNIFSLILSELSQTVLVHDGTDVETWKGPFVPPFQLLSLKILLSQIPDHPYPISNQQVKS